MADTAPATTTETPPAQELTLGQKIVAAVESPETPAVETPEQLSFAQRLVKELGFEGVEDDAQAQERIIAAYRQRDEELAKTKSEFGAQIEALITEVRAAKPQATVETKGQPTGGWNWNPPQVDLQLASKYRTADGWKPETPADLRQAFEARENYTTGFAQKLVNDPEAALGELIDKRAREIVQQTFGQAQTEQQQQSAYSQLVESNAWLFEKDPVTQAPKGLSVQGKRVNELSADILATNYGQYMSKAEVLALAIERFEHEKARAGQVRQTQNQTAQEQAAQRKQELVQRAAPGLPTRNGSTNTPNRNLTPGQRFIQNARANGDTLVS